MQPKPSSEQDQAPEKRPRFGTRPRHYVDLILYVAEVMLSSVPIIVTFIHDNWLASQLCCAPLVAEPKFTSSSLLFISFIISMYTSLLLAREIVDTPGDEDTDAKRDREATLFIVVVATILYGIVLLVTTTASVSREFPVGWIFPAYVITIIGMGIVRWGTIWRTAASRRSAA